MKRGNLELVRCSGNAHRDVARPNADLALARAMMAATIVRIIDARKLSTRGAEKLTGVSHSEFSRIRNTQLGRFTLDRMIGILGKLDDDIGRTRRRHQEAARRYRGVGLVPDPQTQTACGILRAPWKAGARHPATW